MAGCRRISSVEEQPDFWYTSVQRQVLPSKEVYDIFTVDTRRLRFVGRDR